MRLDRILALVGAIAATACGGMSDASPSASTVQAYQALGAEMATAISAYHAETSTMADGGACEAAWGRYEARMAGAVARMQEMSAQMDQHMRGDHHDGAAADMTCVAGAMRLELERHAAAACGAGDVVRDREECAEHVATMTRLMEHQRIRYEDCASRMGLMAPPSETTWTCHQNPDGSFTGGQPWCGEACTSAGFDPEDATTPAPWPPCGCHDGRCG